MKVYKVWILFISMILISWSLSAQIGNYSENEVSDYIQSLIGGEREVSVTSGRVDLVHAEHAYEVEWASKWKESIGQSLWYAQQLNKKPGIILLMKSKEDFKYFLQLSSSLSYAGLDDKIRIVVFPDDFKEFIPD